MEGIDSDARGAITKVYRSKIIRRSSGVRLSVKILPSSFNNFFRDSFKEKRGHFAHVCEPTSQNKQSFIGHPGPTAILHNDGTLGSVGFPHRRNIFSSMRLSRVKRFLHRKTLNPEFLPNFHWAVTHPASHHLFTTTKRKTP